ncbi:hypothetical protein [Roseiflexus sp.]|uniref:hypothetical protein n=1 Tax=Roseiflexus sp. TaxID=2562120 RepID=UPI00398A75D4
MAFVDFVSLCGQETFLVTSDFRAAVAERDPRSYLSLRWLYEQVYAAREPLNASTAVSSATLRPRATTIAISICCDD